MIPMFNWIASGTAFLVSLCAIIAFFIARRQVAIEEGKHLEMVNNLKQDLDHAYDKLHHLENGSHERDISTGEIQANMKHLLAAVQRIEAKLDSHIGAGK